MRTEGRTEFGTRVGTEIMGKAALWIGRALLACSIILVAVPLPSGASNPATTKDPGGNCVSGGNTVAPTDHSPPGGWGWDCTDWIRYSDPWCSAEMLYDPIAGGGGWWRSCDTGGPVAWPRLSIDLWVEMECALTWSATHAQIHRASDYHDIALTFCGTSRCNNGQYIMITPPTASGSLDYLPFVQDMFGRTTAGADIPLTWTYSLDGGPWAPMMDLADHPGSKYFLVDACDHFLYIRVTGDVSYHQEDGYYYLGGLGASICNAEPL
jgi:hypothetical protein